MLFKDFKKRFLALVLFRWLGEGGREIQLELFGNGTDRVAFWLAELILQGVRKYVIIIYKLLLLF